MTDKEVQMIQDKKAKRRLLEQRLRDVGPVAQVLLPWLQHKAQNAEGDEETGKPEEFIPLTVQEAYNLLNVLQFVCALHVDQN